MNLSKLREELISSGRLEEFLDRIPGLRHDPMRTPPTHRFEGAVERNKVETAMRYREWSLKIPQLEFPTGWKVRIVPPFTGAMVRFYVSTENTGSVSIYLDCHGILGAMDEPYWEVHPVEGDVGRVLMDDTERLFELIQQSLDEQEQEITT